MSKRQRPLSPPTVVFTESTPTHDSSKGKQSMHYSSSSPTPSHRSKLSRTSRSPSHKAENSTSSEDDSPSNSPASTSTSVWDLPPHTETYTCTSCRVALPSLWFLDLHISEKHDVLVAKKREEGEKTFRCFIPTCDKITLDAIRRRRHLVDKHLFPRNYDFQVVDRGIRGGSLLRKPGANRGGRARGGVKRHEARRKEAEPNKAEPTEANPKNTSHQNTKQHDPKDNPEDSAALKASTAQAPPKERNKAKPDVNPDVNSDVNLDAKRDANHDANPPPSHPKPKSHRGRPRGRASFARGVEQRQDAEAPASERRSDTVQSPDPRSKVLQSSANVDTASTPDTSMAELAGSLAALRFVPASVRMGRKRPG